VLRGGGKALCYQQAGQSLTCYKGIKNIFALTMITEIGDVKRFPHRRKLVSCRMETA